MWPIQKSKNIKHWQMLFQETKYFRRLFYLKQIINKNKSFNDYWLKTQDIKGVALNKEIWCKQFVFGTLLSTAFPHDKHRTDMIWPVGHQNRTELSLKYKEKDFTIFYIMQIKTFQIFKYVRVGISYLFLQNKPSE